MDISTFPFFRGMAEGDRKGLRANTRRIEYARNDTIVMKGAAFSHIYFIISGRVKEANFTYSGKEIVFNTLTKGDCFGIVSPLRTNVSNSNFVACADTEVFAVQAAEFIRLMRTNASVSESVIAEVTRVMHKYSNKLYEMRALDVSARTRAELLRHTAREANAIEPGYREINDLPTHEEIANTIFTHREAVTREFTRLRKIGVLFKTDQNQLIANVSLLEELVSELS